MQIALGLAIRGGVPVPSLSVANCPTIETATRLQQEVCAGNKLLTVCFGSEVQHCCCPQEVSSSYQVTCTITCTELACIPSHVHGDCVKSATGVRSARVGNACKQSDERSSGKSAVKRWLHK